MTVMLQRKLAGSRFTCNAEPTQRIHKTSCKFSHENNDEGNPKHSSFFITRLYERP
jgi:hypothetical protein